MIFSPPKEEIADLSFLEYFQSEGPVEIEIGCGKGSFLFNRARRCPEIRFLGIDRVSKWMKKKSARAGKEGVHNLKYIKADAREVLKEHIPAESVSIFHIYFPDPWPKRRHNKRRLVTADLLSLLHDRLIPDGRIQIATDDAAYFLHIRKAVQDGRVVWTRVRESVNDRPGDFSEKTNYEMKFEAQGRDIYYLELTK